MHYSGGLLAVRASGLAIGVMMLGSAVSHSAWAAPLFFASVRDPAGGVDTVASANTPVAVSGPNLTASAAQQLLSSTLAVNSGGMSATARFEQVLSSPFPPGVTSVSVQQRYRVTGDFVTEPISSGFFITQFDAGILINGFFYGFRGIAYDDGRKFVILLRAGELVRTFNRFFGSYTLRETFNPSGVVSFGYRRETFCGISTDLPVGPGDGFCAVNLALLPNRSSRSVGIAGPGDPGVAAVAAPGALGLLGLGLGFLALRGRGAAARLSAAA